METYEKILEVLEHERDMELKSAKTGMELLDRTRNPIRRWHLKKSIKSFMDHAFGIQLGIDSIKRNFK